jgi:hypothetical protein
MLDQPKKAESRLVAAVVVAGTAAAVVGTVANVVGRVVVRLMMHLFPYPGLDTQPVPDQDMKTR